MAEHEADDVLRLIVTVVNDQDEPSEDGIGITLTVGGALISGKLIPNWQWFRAVQQQVAAAITSAGLTVSEDDPGTLGVGVVFKDVADRYLEARDQRKVAMAAAHDLPPDYRDALGEASRVGYVHLGEARVFGAEIAGVGVPRSGMYWRGRLTDVSGWSFGYLAPEAMPAVAVSGGF